MFSYCNNNPVIFADPTGTLFEKGAGGGGGGYGNMGVIARNQVLCHNGVVYSTPRTSTVSSAILPVAVAAYGASAAYNSIRQEKFLIKDTERSLALIKHLISSKPSSDTVVYRYHATSSENLAPRKGVDYDCLSFSTKPPNANQLPAVTTTIETIRNTGLFNVSVKGNHVSLKPQGVPVIT